MESENKTLPNEQTPEVTINANNINLETENNKNGIK